MKIKIGFQEFDLRSLVRDDAEKNKLVDGEISYTDSTISIIPGTDPAYQAALLVHEILHGCWSLTGGEAVRPTSEESVVRRLEGPLTAVIRDNPELLGVLHQALCNGRPIV